MKNFETFFQIYLNYIYINYNYIKWNYNVSQQAAND